MERIDIDFSIETSSLPKRITGFNLWASTASNKFSEKPDAEFQLVGSYPIDGARQSSNKYTFKLEDTGGRGGTYESSTEISEAVESTIVKYSLSALVNDKLFVGDCSRKGIENASHILFRSKALRYSTFDWTSELLALPARPTAMFGFRGQLLVFDESQMFIIDPETFATVQKFNVGCPHSQGYVVTEDAVYWCAKEAIYRYGTGVSEDPTSTSKYLQTVYAPVDISSNAIRTTYQTIFDLINFSGFKAVYDSTLKVILFEYYDTENFDLRAISYQVLSGRWDKYIILLTNNTVNWGVLRGKNGETYSVNQAAVYNNFNSSSRRDWRWTSGKINCGTDSVDKKFYKIHSQSSGDPVIYFSIDGGASIQITSGTEIWVSGEYGRGNNISIQVVGDSNDEIYSLALEYRTLVR
jgi:hypothetical protein